ncbi:YifB family Mg chelatase-like AAA ATPase [Arabiibacter massiliensis]|uniref:YifB family Mg chelatase-like AAA ATPase n=1 Tax=Arabiibacter massiliensis TaxID=1870985 RepID=UPI001E3FE7C5|nr:YifB family Mg chelatase-like AAA ATPase [Arabiibacter massiliensis]
MQGQCRVRAATLRGVQAVPVDVEVSVGPGIPGFAIVGMADASVQESRERVRAALRSCGFSVPPSKVVVNLAPGALRKTGSGFDLPIAAGILCATGQIDPRAVEGALFVGELSLEGAVRPVAGLLAYALCARNLGCSLVGAPVDEGLMQVEGLDLRCLKSVAGFRDLPFPAAVPMRRERASSAPDFRDIAGHDMAKRALQVAAAGGHGVLMMGPPGSGKTMLASRLPSILPPLSQAERLETAVVHSVAGEPLDSVLGGVRPFRSPHHSASLAGLVGGGSPLRPGEISLAHNGVLFLDEVAEFAPSVLQGIRQPLEAGRVVITRADGNVEFPARFMLVAASNPCPCGYFGDGEEPCTCTVHQIRTYQGRIGVVSARDPRGRGGVLEGPRTVLERGGPGYPSAFERLAQPPERLYVAGDPTALAEGLAVVGARKATPYGIGCARRFARLAAERGIAVVSGGARGCDAAAHRAALEAGGPTVAFLGGGCDRPYPAENAGLFQRIVDAGGAVVSEHAWDEPPLPYRFRARNRLIAGLARATLIVEAGLPSGTFSTADEALAAGRDVLVVPGAITASSSCGANRLLCQGATPVVDDESFEDALFSLFGCLKQERFEAGAGGAAKGEADPVAAALRSQPLGMEDLYALAVSCCGDAEPRSWLMERLVEAERAGLIARYPDGRWGPVVK